MAKRIPVSIKKLKNLGVEVLPRGNSKTIELPEGTLLEPPCSLKWVDVQHSLSLGAFSYQVSGFCFAAEIGRYCSFGEGVQIGRQNHPVKWASTSPAIYSPPPIFDVGEEFEDSFSYWQYRPDQFGQPATNLQPTRIGHDVWIGHGAYIAAGVKIGSGAVVGAHSVVTKDVPAYTIVAGNPAAIVKLRFSERFISPLLKSEWWKYAPWQLKGCNIECPEAFVHNVMHLSEAITFRPEPICISKNF